MPDQPSDELARALRRLWRDAGEPSTRRIGKAIAYSHTVVSQALRGTRCPSWQIVEKIAVHLGGDKEELRRLWVAARDHEAPLAGPEPYRGDHADPAPPAGVAPPDDGVDGDRSAEALPVVLRWTTTDGARSDTWEFFNKDLALRVIRERLRRDGDGNAAV